jgi:hypothetical protein
MLFSLQKGVDFVEKSHKKGATIFLQKSPLCHHFIVPYKREEKFRYKHTL